MSFIETLVTGNPMMVEVKRFMRRFVGARRGSQQAAIIAVVLCLYLALLGLFASYREIEPIMVVYLQTLIYCLMLPAMMQGSIAGEREKRTWETLLAAPVTKGQIIVGKYAGAVLAVLALAVAMVPLWLAGVSSQEGQVWADPYATTHPIGLGPTLLAEFVAFSFGLALASWCLFVSARSRRTFAAQGMIYGSMVLALVVWPLLTSASGATSREFFVGVNVLHPFISESAIFAAAHGAGEGSDSQLSGGIGWLTSFLNLAFAVLMLVWAEFTLRFAEMEVSFIPRRDRATHR